MADNTAIEWSDTTWNPLLGCSRVSPGCDGCYAISTATIRAGNPHPKVAAAFEGLTERRDGRLDWTGRVNLLPDRLAQPLGWRKPRKVFVNSQADLFHKDVPDEFIAQVFAVMACAPQHTFQVLTKRHARMRSLLTSQGWWTMFAAELVELRRPGAPVAYGYDGEHPALPNVHLGVSVESQQWADIRIPALLGTPAAVRWLSCEPLLGPVIIQESWLSCDHQSHTGTGELNVWACDGCGQRHQEIEDPTGPSHVLQVSPRRQYRARDEVLSPGQLINWVVVGGESGPKARPMQLTWARSLRDQCVSANVPLLFKQWGGWVPPSQMPADTFMTWDIAHGTDACDREAPWKVGKKAAGRELDGRTWDEYPAERPAVAA